MLSILIPVYNFDVTDLVTELGRQCQDNGLTYEIRCMDDCSDPAFKRTNRLLSGLPGVFYSENEHNLGRSAIRNKLATEAQYPYLFFLDCDSGTGTQFSISRYLPFLHPNKVLNGGRIYIDDPPEQKELLLHWNYGKHREQKTAVERKRQPYHSFMSNNFLIPKALFQSILFDETLRQYGHEDTLFGLELKNKGIEIIHLDNPLLHLGLESNRHFLHKSKLALYNLALIARRNTVFETRLLNLYQTLRKFRLQAAFRCCYRVLKPLIIKNLTSSRPNLRLFDLFKIGELSELLRTDRRDLPKTTRSEVD